MLTSRALKLLICLTAALCLTAANASASTEARVGASRAIVTVPGASATVDFDPLRISFADRRGRTVLRQLSGRAGAQQDVPAVPRSQFGAQDPPAPTLYAPLSFLVGHVDIAQVPSWQWAANLDSVTESRNRVRGGRASSARSAAATASG